MAKLDFKNTKDLFVSYIEANLPAHITQAAIDSSLTLEAIEKWQFGFRDPFNSPVQPVCQIMAGPKQIETETFSAHKIDGSFDLVITAKGPDQDDKILVYGDALKNLWESDPTFGNIFMYSDLTDVEFGGAGGGLSLGVLFASLEYKISST